LEKNDYWTNINEKNNELNSLYSAYWEQYSGFTAWQFWVTFALFVLPLIFVYFKIDKRRLFEIFFFGFSVHMLWAYTDLALGRNGYLNHQYFMTPALPVAANITASLLPVGYLLIYQYCTNRHKNFYLYGFLLSVIFAIGFGSLEKWFGFTEFNKGMNQFYLLLIDIVIFILSYWFTNLMFVIKKSREQE